MGRSLSINKSLRLLSVYIICKRALKKHIIDIKSANVPIFMNNNGKDDANSGWFNNRTKCIMEVDTRALVKSFGNKTRFVARDRPIRVPFNLVNPLTTNNVLRRMRWD